MEILLSKTFLELNYKLEMDNTELIESRYKILYSQEGGFGKVFICEDLLESRKVALKTIKPLYINSSSKLASFYNEAELWVSLGNIKHVVAAYEIKKINNKPFIVAEFAGGWNLRSWINQKEFPIEEALRVVSDICQGMTNIQAINKNFVHGDLSPENILIRSYIGFDMEIAEMSKYETPFKENGGHLLTTEKEKIELYSKISGKQIYEKIIGVKISDFGLSKIIDFKNVPNYPLNDLSGKLPYIAPERFKGRPANILGDIYSFGIIFYECFYGQHPYSSSIKSIHDFQSAHLEAKPEFSSNIEKEINELIENCLEKEPQNRYQHFNEVFKQIDKVRLALAKCSDEFKAELQKMINNDLPVNIEKSLEDGKTVINMSMNNEYVNPRYDNFDKIEFKFKTNIERAIVLITKGDFIGARQILDKMNTTSLDKHNVAFGFLKVSECYFLNNFFEDAYKYAEKTLELSDDMPSAIFYKGSSLSNLGNPAEGIEILKKYCTIVDEEKLPNVYTNIGATIFNSFRKEKEAIDYFEKALQIDPEFIPALNCKAVVYLNQGNFENSLKCVIKVLSQRPHDGKANMILNEIKKNKAANNR